MLRREAANAASLSQAKAEGAERESRQKEDEESSIVMDHLPPSMVLTLRDISLEMTRMKSQLHRGLPLVPSGISG
jgi:hypothetical protein